MKRAAIIKKLDGLSAEIRTSRAELAVIDEQLVQLTDEVDQARVRALVSETPLSSREYREAERNCDRQIKYREELSHRIDSLISERDRLLDQLSELGS